VARGDPLAERFRPSALQEQQVEAGRVGRKTGAGFYAYSGGVAVEPAASGSLDPETRDRIVERIEVAIANEAYRARDEGVAGADDIDRAMRLGAGHPLGPFERWAEQGRAPELEDRLISLRALGPRFEPAPGLNDGPV
jgi:3-hydroxyacyl-CoA dehydrogenase